MPINTEDSETPQLVREFRGHNGWINRIAWSPDGRLLASASNDETINIWDYETGNLIKTLTGYGNVVIGVAWSPDGKHLASGAGDNTVRVWNTTTWDVEKTFAGHYNWVFTVAWSPNGRFLASGSSDCLVIVWDVQTCEPLHTFNDYHGVFSLSWSPDGKYLASASADSSICIRDVDTWEIAHLKSHTGQVLDLAWSPKSRFLASGSVDNTVRVWSTDWRLETVLEGHTGHIRAVDFCSNGHLLVTKSSDHTVRIWRCDTWENVATIQEQASDASASSSRFHPTLPILATLGEDDRIIRIWRIDENCMLRTTGFAVRYTSAKIVLVGKSDVGKSCLSMRLAEDQYPGDDELGTTHGMRFWTIEAEDLHPLAKPPEGHQRDVVLWDFGGQDEYQLVHEMFLHDTTLALVLIDPTRGTAMEEARSWNKRLEKHLRGRPAVKLLVGAKQDQPSRLVNRAEIDTLQRECGFAAYIETSAKNGRNIKTLCKQIAKALDWGRLAKTSRPELFQRIREMIDERRKSGEIVVLVDELVLAMSQQQPNLEGRFADECDKETKHQQAFAAVRTVVEQLAAQGVIVATKLMTGKKAVVLQLPVIECYAGSLIVAARNNPRGVPALEERLLSSTQDIPLPGMAQEERLKGEKERIVLECVVELMIQHGLCFRHGGLLVFPTLFPTNEGDNGKIPYSTSLFYDFSGAIDNIYASLVARLMVSEGFGEGRLWAGRVEFDRPSEGVCGLQHTKRNGGFAHVDLFFGKDTNSERRNLFTRFVEEHLRLNGVEIQEHEAIKCACGEMIEERIVQENITRGEIDVICPRCRKTTLIGKGVERIRGLDPESDQKILALRKATEEQTAKHVMAVKASVQVSTQKRTATEPIRVLHLSDLHFTSNTAPNTALVPLLQDIRNGEFLGFGTVEYLVISGDMTNCGSEEGLDKAREFVQNLITELKLSAQRCIFVPGNHDLQDLRTSYVWNSDVAGLKGDQWVKQGNIYLVRDDDEYPKRLQKFSDAFFHKIVPGQPYPLDPANQGISYLFDDTKIQFLAFNSAWQIDQFHRKRSSLHADAVSNAIDAANKQISGQDVLRICVWHHSIQHRETMQNTNSVELLQSAGVRLCLHGDVHEMNRERFRYWCENKFDVVGVGSFGAPAEGRPESMPCLYNLLEIQSDHSAIRVHTRRRVKSGGPWNGWYEWENPNGTGQVPYYDIDLSA